MPFTEILNKVELAAVIKERTMMRHGPKFSGYNQRQEEATQHQVEQGLGQEQLRDELAHSQHDFTKLQMEFEEWKLGHAELHHQISSHLTFLKVRAISSAFLLKDSLLIHLHHI